MDKINKKKLTVPKKKCLICKKDIGDSAPSGSKVCCRHMDIWKD
jgi:phosphoribosyl-dephospho-CoA transferase